MLMPITPEDRARLNIDKLLADAGWIVQDKRQTNLSAGRGVAVREFPLKAGHGEADYLLFVDSAPIGIVEAKKEGDTPNRCRAANYKVQRRHSGQPSSPTTPIAFSISEHGGGNTPGPFDE